MIHPVLVLETSENACDETFFEKLVAWNPTTSIKKTWILNLLNGLWSPTLFHCKLQSSTCRWTRDKLRQMPWWNHIAGSLQSGTPFLALLRKKPRKLIESTESWCRRVRHDALRLCLQKTKAWGQDAPSQWFWWCWQSLRCLSLQSKWMLSRGSC